MTMEKVIELIEAGKVKYPELWKAMQFTVKDFWALMTQDSSLVYQVLNNCSDPILFFAE